jgi:histidyl-tRNA synthetase
MESLGGEPTPAVGWAAGIERLAMLLGERDEGDVQVVVVVEDDALLNQGISAVAALRRSGLSAELVATGSPRKRFDKAVKAGAKTLVALAMRDGQPQSRLKGGEDIAGRIETALQDLLA